jgi:hypothetical protein
MSRTTIKAFANALASNLLTAMPEPTSPRICGHLLYACGPHLAFARYTDLCARLIPSPRRLRLDQGARVQYLPVVCVATLAGESANYYRYSVLSHQAVFSVRLMLTEKTVQLLPPRSYATVRSLDDIRHLRHYIGLTWYSSLSSLGKH